MNKQNKNRIMETVIKTDGCQSGVGGGWVKGAGEYIGSQQHCGKFAQ